MFLHDDEAVLTFHADNIERIGIVGSKCFKFFCPDSFGQHAKNCTYSLSAITKKVEKWKDSPHVWANVRRVYGKHGEFKSKTLI